MRGLRSNKRAGGKRSNLYSRSVARMLGSGVTTVLVLGFGLFVSVGSTKAATAEPVWLVQAAATPTEWQETMPGGPAGEYPPTIHVQVENIGGATTTGAFTLTDELPAGVTLRPEQEILVKWTTGAGGGSHLNTPPVSCTAGGQTITCEGPATYLGNPVDLRPGEGFQISIPLEANGLVPPAVTNVASIAGGNATTVTQKLAIPIGTAKPSFEFLAGPTGLNVSTSAADGTGESLAGAHPYQFSFSLGSLRSRRKGALALRFVFPRKGRRKSGPSYRAACRSIPRQFR